ncbi:hypothetical protein BKG86_17035 [Mycobacteroides chelonae]|uniref:hypothetical protein n=1 Tax=Mycobacteroides chelonae TaxID=1774 RepID=UPI0008A85218|nr:hypothetical protein [Mycobacteroides chelonae]OHU71358.1 hypothetical protein BKG86_17035 [Mycobacteroides chelonae]
MRKRLITATAAALLLSGCTSLDHGVVMGKDHYPAYSTVTTTLTCTGGKNPTCTPIVIPIFVPGRFVLHLRDSDKTGDRDVTEGEYCRYQVGQVYP